MNEKTLVQRIKGICDQKGISISKLEQDLEFSAGLCSRWDKSSPSADRIVAVAKYLDSSTDYLLGLKDDNPNTLKNKFIKTLYEKTEDYDINWIIQQDKSLWWDRALDRLIDKTFNNEITAFQESDTYYTIFNGSAIYIAKQTFELKNLDIGYMLFAQFNPNIYEDENNYSIISDDTNELKPLYNSIKRIAYSGDNGLKEKLLMESFLNKYQTTNNLLDNYKF
jgi:transcriptional regulator with XRE-family HTH domain